MDIYHLPSDIFPDSDCLKDDIIVHEYTAPLGSFKGKSILQKNAISLVLHGEKTMRFAEKTVVTNDHEFHFLSAGNCLVTSRKVIKGKHTGDIFGIPPSGNNVEINVIDIIRLKDGKYAEHWGMSNFSEVIAGLSM